MVSNATPKSRLAAATSVILKTAGGLAAAIGVVFSAPALAQSTPEPLPAHVQTDGNGVDLATGDLFLSATDVAIGPQGAGGLSYGRVYAGTGWRGTATGTISSSGSVYTVSMGASSESFNNVGGAYVSDRRLGSTLEYNSGSQEYTYTTADGTVSIFDATLAGQIDPASANEAVLVKTTAPNGATVDYHYKTKTVSSTTRARLQSVTNAFGYQLHFEYDNDNPSTVSELEDEWMLLTKVTGINNAVDYCAPTADTCSGFSETWPVAQYSGSSNAGIAGVTTRDSSGALTRLTSYGYEFGKLKGVTWPESSQHNLLFYYHTSGTFNGWVSAVSRGFGTWSYAYEDDTPTTGEQRTTVTNPVDDDEIVDVDKSTGLISLYTDGVGEETSYQYDTYDRPTRVTQPEGNYVQYTYDSRGNVTQTKQVAKPSSGLNDIITTATFPGTCSNPVICNKPTKTTDARGQETDYVYDATHGGVLKVTAPAPASGADRPETRISYVQKQARFKDGASSYVNGPQIYVLEESSACATGEYVSGACEDGNAVETVTQPVWPGTSSPNNLQPLSVTTADGAGSLSSTTSFAYDAFGRLEYTDGPLAGSGDRTRNIYDAAGQLMGAIGPDPDGASGPLPHTATRFSYNALGLIIGQEQGKTNSYFDADLTHFISLQKTEVEYDDYARLVKTVRYDGATTTVLSVSQASYDVAGRTQCTARRMNPSTFASPPTSACTAGTSGSFGEDRITKRQYTAAGQVQKVITAYGSSLQQDVVTYSYRDNGQVEYLDDAQGYRTLYVYDGHDRRVETHYPDPDTTATANSDDKEVTTYSNATGVTLGLLTKITTRSEEDITYTHDLLGRVTRKHVPGSANGTTSLENHDYTYDNFGRVTSAVHWGVTLAYTYDALGRLVKKEHNASVPVEYAYDAAGRVTTLTHPDGWEADYEYDVLGRPTAVKNGSTTFASVSYDDLGRRASLNYDNGTSTNYAYDGGSRLLGLDIDLAGTADDQSYGFDYNPASQLIERTRTNSDYDWMLPNAATDDYIANGLNQYESVDGVSVTHDDNGNLATDHRGWAYTYAADNRLRTVTNASSQLVGNYAYYADGNRRIGNGSRFYYDGDQEIAEYDTAWPLSSGSIKRRFVRLPGSVDEVLLMIDYDSSGCSPGCEVYVHADRQGSTVATSDASGDVIDKYTYSVYGASGDEGNTGFPFRYTGQRLDGATGLYYYKARFYDPEVGRFLQTDPIGYGDGMNMYAYAGGDPVNFSDPTGLSGAFDPEQAQREQEEDSGYDENPGCSRISGANLCAGAGGAALFSGGGAAFVDFVGGHDSGGGGSWTVCISGGSCTTGSRSSGRYIPHASPANDAYLIEKYGFAPGHLCYMSSVSCGQANDASWLLDLAAGAGALIKFGAKRLINLGDDAVNFARKGREISFGRDFRIAPFGNRTGNRYGRFPHYHRRGTNFEGVTQPGQGIGRHRPWETKATDKSFWDRF